MGIKKDGKLLSYCLDNLQEGEPFFVLRGQDISTPLVIMEWLKLNPQILASPKFGSAIDSIKQMIEWQKQGKSKSAD